MLHPHELMECMGESFRGCCSSGVRGEHAVAQIASEQTPRGNFVERKNNEFVTIAYVPLKSEV
jgi:hypothetical protein